MHLYPYCEIGRLCELMNHLFLFSLWHQDEMTVASSSRTSSRKEDDCWIEMI